ncbi:hypothetical protein ABID22_004088 [Pontibacter aydingkolensis]|uniref:WYL domain-containing protein n=1 Tax=Pontibacter aydingkolensis TaxID=1911536 RepID=A0ABS7CZS4_9BACT|nr:hypothetical protein [Pontibacter aydingkolensis]MBW7469322.1 hypothetical protein [Pontibacter aydingkolensis]
MLIKFEYKGSMYMVEPHLLGRSHEKQDCLLAWVVTGKDTQDTWHTFLLTDISRLKIMEQRFTKQRPGYDPYESSMSRIYYRI